MNLDTPSRGSSRAFSPSPLRNAEEKLLSQGVPASQAAAYAAIDQSILARRVGVPTPKAELSPIPFRNLRDSQPAETGCEICEDESTKADSVSVSGEVGNNPDGQKEVSVSHVLTNVIVLQEFLLELAALVQVRAGLFGEVRFV